MVILVTENRELNALIMEVVTKYQRMEYAIVALKVLSDQVMI